MPRPRWRLPARGGRRRAGSASRRARRARAGSSHREGRTRGRRRSARAGRRGRRRHFSQLELLFEQYRRPLGRRFGLVCRIEVVDRPLPLPLPRQQQHADKGGVLAPRRRRQDGILGTLEPRLTGAENPLDSLRVDRQLAVEEPPDPRAWMDMPMGDTAGRKVDPVAADDPAGRGIELHLGGEGRPGLVAVELPHERRTVHTGCPEPRRVPLEVVDDARSWLGHDSLRMLVERKPQWKYCPPSITMVWPVMKPAAGVQRKTTAPTTSSGS